MAGQKRLNIPGAIHHIITRGLNGMALFKDDRDPREILKRLSLALEKTTCQCYGWALMSNHVHLLLRPTKGDGGRHRNSVKSGAGVQMFK